MDNQFEGIRNFLKIELFFFSGISLIALFLYISLFIVYYSKRKTIHLVAFLKVLLCVCSFCSSLSNFLSLINYFTDDFREKGLSRFIPFLRLITDMGIESIQVAIIFSTLISFKYSAFIDNCNKTFKIIIFSIIILPILIIFICELTNYASVSEVSDSIFCNDFGFCFCYGWKYLISIIFLFLCAIFLTILIILNVFLCHFFKDNPHQEEIYQSYRKNIRTFYFGLCVTFPYIILIIFYAAITINAQSYFIFLIFEILLYSIFPIGTTMIYCLNKPNLVRFKEIICCQKYDDEDGKMSFIVIKDKQNQTELI